MLLPILLLLPFAVTAVDILNDTQASITVTLPPSVCTSLQIPSSYTIQTLNGKSVEDILKDYVRKLDGIDGTRQTPLLLLAREIKTQYEAGNITRAEYDMWNGEPFALEARQTILQTVAKLVDMQLARDGRGLTRVDVFCLLDKMRKGRRGWVGYGLFLEARNDNLLRIDALEALAEHLVVTEQAKTVRVELQESLAREVGSPTVDLIRIDERTTVEEIYTELEHGIWSQIATKDLMRLLIAQNEAGLMSDSQYDAWNLHKSLMKKEREIIIGSFVMIQRIDSTLSVPNMLSIFKWHQGGMALIDFVHTVLMKYEPGVWRRVCFEFRVKTLEYISASPLHWTISDPLGATHFNFVRIKPDTDEYVLYEEFVKGLPHQRSLETFLRILDKANHYGYLNEDDYQFWYSEPSYMLSVRMKFVQSVNMIGKFTRDASIDTSIAIFRWRRDTSTIHDFTQTLPPPPSESFSSFWKHVVEEYGNAVGMKRGHGGGEHERAKKRGKHAEEANLALPHLGTF